MKLNSNQEAFMEGLRVGLQARQNAPTYGDAYRTMRAAPTGIGSVIADPDIITEKSIQGVSTGVLGGLIGAIVMGLLGLGAGTMVGAPGAGLASGAILGGGIGGTLGLAKGQMSAEREALRARGLNPRIPIPAKELLFPAPIGAILPTPSYMKFDPIEY